MKIIPTNSILFALTFDQVIEFGKREYENRKLPLVHGMPWSFTLFTPYGNFPVTHENDSEYIIYNTRLQRGNVFVVAESGYTYTLPNKVVEDLFTKIGD